MKGQAESTDVAVLRRHWRRWTALVDQYARRRRGYSALDPQEYQRLHKDLLAACTSLNGASAGSQHDFYRGLANLVRPWLTLRVLEQADREILLDLLARCWEADKV